MAGNGLIAAHNELHVELGSREGLLAFGAYAIVKTNMVQNKLKVGDARDVARICHIDIRTARRLWPLIEPLLKA